ncbi:MAG: L-histidine N(alpha)-methyltransferase [Bacteroidota bacterium]
MSVKLQFNGSEQVSDKIFALPAAEFAKDVVEGLTATEKYLSSKYFYDERGDELFQQIMALESYYLTRAEFQIFENQSASIIEVLKERQGSFQLLEFGAGDGTKTKVLLRAFLEAGLDFRYCPIDISDNVLKGLTDSLHHELPDLKVEGLHGDYFQVLDALNRQSDERKVILFLGSNIGNFSYEKAQDFLGAMSTNLHTEDLLLIGIDIKKDPKVILNAYDDPEGVTAQFNLNLLSRINNELDADFELDNFQHYASYNPQNGECRSYLMSKCKQQVRLGALDMTVDFKAWEEIHMEISKKYSLEEIGRLAESSGFSVKKQLLDDQQFFVDSFWEVR